MCATGSASVELTETADVRKALAKPVAHIFRKPSWNALIGSSPILFGGQSAGSTAT